MNEYRSAVPAGSVGRTATSTAAPATHNSYALPKVWAHAPSSSTSTPTNASKLTANATFPNPFQATIPPLYPSISGQSNTSLHAAGGGSPFTAHTPLATNPAGTAYSFNPHTQPSQSSSSSSLHALAGSMGKLHINTSYNPYSLPPYAAAGGQTPTGNNSAANTPNHGQTPTGWRWNNYSYPPIATPPTPATLNGNPFMSGNLQATAAMNNLNSLGLNYRMSGLKAHPAHAHAQHALPTLSNPPSINNLALSQSLGGAGDASKPQTPHSKLLAMTPSTTTPVAVAATKLNSNAAPYQPRNITAAVSSSASPSNAQSSQQSQPQPQGGGGGGIPSYADAAKLTMNMMNMMNMNMIHHHHHHHAIPPVSGAGAGATSAAAVSDSKSPSKSPPAKTSGKTTGGAGAGGEMGDPDAVDVDADPSAADGGAAPAPKMSSESEEAIQKLNPPQWPSAPRHAKFYVIKSFGEDDVHKSIKYNLWCSTERGNRKLEEAFHEANRINGANHKQRVLDDLSSQVAAAQPDTQQQKPASSYVDPRDTVRGCPVYLFYSVNRSGCFCGMAQLISSYYGDRHFGSWVQDGKWQGSFIVKWIYVKDIPNKDLKDIQLPNNDGRPVTFSRDTQEIPFAQGVEMLRRFIKYVPKTNILQDFKYYDDRERDIKQKRTQQILFQQMQQQQKSPPSSSSARGAHAAHGGFQPHSHGGPAYSNDVREHRDRDRDGQRSDKYTPYNYYNGGASGGGGGAGASGYGQHNKRRFYGGGYNGSSGSGSGGNYGTRYGAGGGGGGGYQSSQSGYHNSNSNSNAMRGGHGHGGGGHSSQYANYQILKRGATTATATTSTDNPPTATKVHNENEHEHEHEHQEGGQNKETSHEPHNEETVDNSQSQSPNRLRKNFNHRNRNRWVPKD